MDRRASSTGLRLLAEETVMPFADELIGPQTARALVKTIQAVVPDLPLTSLRSASRSLEPLALRERADLLRDALLADIVGDYWTVAQVIRDARDSQPAFTGWMIWPVTSALAAKAVSAGTDPAFDDALDLLSELTSRLTSEFAIRVLLNHDLERALTAIVAWTRSDDEDTRRLASEGTRPFLPWSARVPDILAHPRSTLPIIDALYRDPSEYVRRSVSNHLNDLSRQQPQLVIDISGSWLSNGDEHTEQVVRHGLRTLIKNGNPAALQLMGFGEATLRVVGPNLATATIAVGEALDFTATVENAGQSSARLAIDYVVHHRKANGSLSAKTFKLTTKTLAPGQEVDLRRSHSFREITTRHYYPGSHAVELQINGIRYGRTQFDLARALSDPRSQVSRT